MTISIQPITGKPIEFIQTYHEKPWALKIYVNIINKLVEACRKAIAEESENLSVFKRVMVDTKGKPKFLVKQQMGAAKLVQRERSDEARRAFRQLLSSLQDEITGSFHELKFLYELEIGLGMDKFYSTEKDLEMKTLNLGQRYDKAGIETLSDTFIAAVAYEKIPVLYFFDRYCPEENAEQMSDLMKPWLEKTASKLNPNLGKIMVLLTMFANLPQLLGEIVGDPAKTVNHRIPSGTPVGSEGSDMLLFTLLQTPTSFLNPLSKS